MVVMTFWVEDYMAVETTMDFDTCFFDNGIFFTKKGNTIAITNKMDLAGKAIFPSQIPAFSRPNIAHCLRAMHYIKKRGNHPLNDAL